MSNGRIYSPLAAACCGKIAEETLFGEYFWTGRGFGENLADSHGFRMVSAADVRVLRSPHNVHMPVLSRTGVPGLLLWLGLYASLMVLFFRRWQRARRAGDRFLQGVLAWAMCYWTAAVVNATLDVYLDGPQGAIWFWTVMGIGLAAARIQPTAAGVGTGAVARDGGPDRSLAGQEVRSPVRAT
jgi:O-antigen ligase